MSTTSPEALREAVERLENLRKLSSDASFPIARLVTDKHRQKLSDDLTLVLSALQEAREALGQRDGLLHSWVELKDRLGADSFDGIEPTYVLQLDQLAATTRLAVGCHRD